MLAVVKSYSMEPSGQSIRFRADHEEYVVRLKLFSLSATVMDATGSLVATMNRTSWWRLKFRIRGRHEQYLFSCSALDSALLVEGSGDKYTSMGSTGLFDAKAMPIAELSRDQSRPGALILDISISEHHEALMLVACLQYKTVLQAPGYGL